MKKRTVLFSIIIVVFVFIGIGVSVSQSNYSNIVMPIVPTSSSLILTATRPSKCVPIPWLAVDKGFPTSTPGRLDTPNSNSSSLFQTATPETIAHIYDLSPSLSIDKKIQIYVFRCDGTEDKYFADPLFFVNKTVSSVITLGDGDVIMRTDMDSSPQSRRPPSETPSSKPTIYPSSTQVQRLQTTTPQPYPPPSNPLATSTNAPLSKGTSYPAP